jgi:cell volume regulation protein A
LYVLAPPWRVYLLDSLFQPHREEAPERDAEFVFSGETRLGTVTDLYGLAVPTDQADATIADHFADTLSEQPVVGDRIEGDGYSLVVRQMDEERVGQVGLRLHGEAPTPLLRGNDAPKRILKRLLRRLAGP